MRHHVTTPENQFDRRAHLLRVGQRTRFQPRKVERVCEECGTTFERIESRAGRFCGYACSNRAMARQRDYAKGPASPTWKGGTTAITRARTNTQAWRALVALIRERDGQRCQDCGATTEQATLTVHHLIPWEATEDDSLENLLTLCMSCHMVREYALRWLIV